MRKSTIMHWIARVSGILGGFALVGAWIAEGSGTAFGFSQQRFYNDAIILTLISISAFVCVLVYLKEENN